MRESELESGVAWSGRQTRTFEQPHLGARELHPKGVKWIAKTGLLSRLCDDEFPVVL
jgi:hypothetical protein